MREILFLLALGAFLLPSAPARDGGKDEILVVRASRFDRGDGKGLRAEKIRLLFSGGKILSLEKDEGPLPEGSRFLAWAPVLVPGLVSAATDLAGPARDLHPVTPDYLAAWASLPPGTRKRILRAGITTFHVSPGRDRFLPGQGALLQPGPAPGKFGVLRSPSDLFLVLGERGKMRGMVFDPVVFPDENHLLGPAARLMPSSLAGQALLARKLFALVTGPTPPRTFRYGGKEWSLAPLLRAARKKLPVRFVCDSAAAVRTALSLAKTLKLRAILEDLRPSGDPSDFAEWKPEAVIVRLPVELQGPNPGDPAGTRPSKRPDPTYAARLHAAGIPLILAPASDRDLGSLLLAAGVAVRAGLPPGEAMKALTLEPARALGAADRVGSLERGKEADFLLLSGDPFDAATSLLGVFRAGKPMKIEPAGTGPLLAVRAGEVHLGDGRVLKPGTVLVEKGKIVAAAGEIALPPGTKLLDRPGMVVTPGFLDADSRLGLRASAASRRVSRRFGAVVVTRAEQAFHFPRLGPGADLGLLVRPGGPGFPEAARAGVTAVLVTGEGNSGRGCLLKTAVEKKPLAPLAALHFPLSSLQSLQGNLARAEGHLKKVEAWKKAYAEWRKERFGPASRPARPFRSPPEGTGNPPREKKKPGAATRPAKKVLPRKAPSPGRAPSGGADPVSGVWKGTIAGLPGGKKAPFILRLRLRRRKVTGLLQGPFRFRKGAPPIVPLAGKYADGNLDLKARTRSGKTILELQAALSGEEMEGTWILLGGRMKGTLRAHREKKPAAPVWEEIPPGQPELVLEEIDDDLDLSEMEVDPDLGDFASPLPPLPVPGPAVLAAADPVSGTWKGEIRGIPRMGTAPFTAKLILSGEVVFGSVVLPFHRRGGPSSQEIQGTYSGGVLRMSGKRIPIRMEASLEKDHMEGNWSLGPFKGTFTADRVSSPDGGRKESPAPKGKPKAAPTGAPAKPMAPASLEPWVGVLLGKTSLILHPSTPAVLAETLAWLKKDFPRIRVIVSDGTAARKSLEALAKAGAAVLLGPGSGSGRGWEGPAAYSRAGIPILFGSASAEGTRWLPLQAAFSVSKGLEKEKALMALTSWPARWLGVSQRLGLLAPGRDADLVIWTGDPFNLRSKVSTVIVSGKVVFQNHE